MSLPRPPHGAVSLYNHGCRCGLCRAARTAYGRVQRARARLRAQRIPRGFVPADQARAHLLALSAAGVGYRAAGEACDVSRETTWRIVSGRQQRCLEATARAILSVTPEAIADGAEVDPADTRARLAELRDEGYTLRQIARMLGRRTLEVGRKRTVRAITHLRVEQLYRRVMEVAA